MDSMPIVLPEPLQEIANLPTHDSRVQRIVDDLGPRDPQTPHRTFCSWCKLNCSRLQKYSNNWELAERTAPPSSVWRTRVMEYRDLLLKHSPGKRFDEFCSSRAAIMDPAVFWPWVSRTWRTLPSSVKDAFASANPVKAKTLVPLLCPDEMSGCIRAGLKATHLYDNKIWFNRSSFQRDLPDDLIVDYDPADGLGSTHATTLETLGYKSTILDMVVYPQKYLVVTNTHGYNSDPRSHMEEPEGWVDPFPGFTVSIVSPTGFTLQDVITAVYKTKGSKFDHWYELFCGADIEIEGDIVRVNAEFDHGS